MTPTLFTKYGSLINKFRTTEVYQIFVVRASQKTETTVLYWLFIGLLGATITFWLDRFNPVLDLAQMHTEQGILAKFTPSSRSNCANGLTIKTIDQQLLKYKVCLNTQQENELKSIVGQPITVWSQSDIGIFGSEEQINQIQHDEHLLIDYGNIKPHAERSKVTMPWITRVLALITMLPLLRIWWVNRREITK